eukprot:852660-Rhodomonas_salina.1
MGQLLDALGKGAAGCDTWRLQCPEDGPVRPDAAFTARKLLPAVILRLATLLKTVKSTRSSSYYY